MKKFFLVLAMYSFAALAQDGAEIFKKCVTCHGADGLGKKAQNAPMIAGQFDWYLIDQITQIRDKKRDNAKTKTMYPFVKGLKDEEIKAVAKYISEMEVKKNVKP